MTCVGKELYRCVLAESSSKTSCFPFESDWRVLGVCVAVASISPLPLVVFHYFLDLGVEIQPYYALSEDRTRDGFISA